MPGRAARARLFGSQRCGRCRESHVILSVFQRPTAGRRGPHPRSPLASRATWARTPGGGARPVPADPTAACALAPPPTSGRTAVTWPDRSLRSDAASLVSSVPSSLPPEVGRLSLSGYGSPSGGGGRTGSRAAAGAVMAELVQGQSAPVGMKAEGFVDALHRVRQVRARPAGGSGGARGAAGPSPVGGGGRLGREAARLTPPSGLAVPCGPRSPGRRRLREAQARPAGGSPRSRQPPGKGLARTLPHRAGPERDLQGSQLEVLRFAVGELAVRTRV